MYRIYYIYSYIILLERRYVFGNIYGDIIRGLEVCGYLNGLYGIFIRSKIFVN